MNRIEFLFFLTILLVSVSFASIYETFNKQRALDSGSREIKERCPKVKAIRNFDLVGMMGFWYVVQYYASSEEAQCMHACEVCFQWKKITMNFTYVFGEDPLEAQMQGNLTWVIPNADIPAHWTHAEDIYEGIYNTYIIDTDYKSWALIMHCAEKTKSERYLSALLLSRAGSLGMNVINFLREKLPRYDIDTSFMFPIKQDNCEYTNMTDLHQIIDIQ